MHSLPNGVSDGILSCDALVCVNQDADHTPRNGLPLSSLDNLLGLLNLLGFSGGPPVRTCRSSGRHRT